MQEEFFPENSLSATKRIRRYLGLDAPSELMEALRRDRVVFDPGDSEALATLRADAERIASRMDAGGECPPMLWSGIPLPGPLREPTCDYQLVLSIGGTKTEFALLRLERGQLLGFDLDSGVEVVPVLIGAFGIPQIIQVLKDRFQIGETQKFQRILPEFGTIVRNVPRIIRSALIGVGIGSVPGAFAGGFIVGLAANMALLVIPSGYGPALPFLIILVTLYFRPYGLLGEAR